MLYRKKGESHIEFFMELVRLGYFSIDENGIIWREMKRCGAGGYIKTHTNISKSTKKGYIHIPFYTYLSQGEGKRRIRKKITCYAHNMVYNYFIGEIPEGQTVNHKDGNPQNNKPKNLDTLTPYGQMKHAREVLGTTNFLEHRNPMAKMNEEDYDILKRMVDEGKGPKEIHKYFPFMSFWGIQSARKRYLKRKRNEMV